MSAWQRMDQQNRVRNGHRNETKRNDVNGDNLQSWLLLATVPPPFKFVSSSVKRSIWASRTQYFSAFLISPGSRVSFRLASGPVFFSCLSLDALLCSFWNPAILHLDINRRTYAVILNNLSQDENFSASSNGSDFLLWNESFIFDNSCLPSSVQSVWPGRLFADWDFSTLYKKAGPRKQRALSWQISKVNGDTCRHWLGRDFRWIYATRLATNDFSRLE